MAKPPEAVPRMGAGVRQLLRHHFLGTVRLAGPVMIARSGALVMITVDVIMTGRAGAGELAFYALGLAPAQFLHVVGLGFLIGTMVLSSQADGRGERSLCGTIWHMATGHALVAGLLFAALLFFGGEFFFLLTGQSPEMARGGAKVLAMFAWGLPGAMLYLATALFMDGISRPNAGMVLMIAANLMNVGLNWLFIYDHGAIGGMGGQGAALATSIIRWLLWASLAGYALLMPGATRYGVGRLRFSGVVNAKLLAVGLPVGLAHGLESGAFVAMVMFAGRLGALPLAVYQIAQSLFTIVYMLAIGAATATNVRVGNAVGRGDRSALIWSGWTGIGLAATMLLMVMGIFQTFAAVLAGIFSTDVAVLAPAAHAIVVISFFVVADGIQGVAVGALRGAGDVWFPTGIVTVGFWGVSVPLAYYGAFIAGWGVEALLWGLFAGALTATFFLLERFRRVARKEVRAL